MDFFTYLLNSIEGECTFKRVGDRPLSLQVDGSLCTEVLYNDELYRIFVQKDELPKSDVARILGD